MTTQQAKMLDITEYLISVNIRPARITGHQYWYYSPFRDERTPSFKVNKQLNLWYDFAEGKGGNFIDLGVRLHSCSVKELLNILSSKLPADRELSSIVHQCGKHFVSFEDSAIKILSSHLISSYGLIKYLQSRKILVDIADRYLQEIRYQIHDKIFYALGFENNLGGYELRSPFFKGSSSPKGITFIDNKSNELCVFEGCFDFLSYLCFKRRNNLHTENYLILNSLSFFASQLTMMQSHSRIRLYLDNDDAGSKATALALSLDSKKFMDKRCLYQNFKDLNDWWTLYSSA